MEYTPDRQGDHNARLLSIAVALIVALAFILQRFAPAQPQQPAYYLPDPTPFVVETQHIEIFSRNCLGYCPQQ